MKNIHMQLFPALEGFDLFRSLSSSTGRLPQVSIARIKITSLTLSINLIFLMKSGTSTIIWAYHG